MWPLLLSLLLADAQISAPAPGNQAQIRQTIKQDCTVRALPGKLDDILMFNSNSPEVVQKEGILLSTFPAQDMKDKEAHLNLPLSGHFNIFAHHIYKSDKESKLRTLYLGIIVQNAGTMPADLRILEGQSYLSQPDAPFIPLNSYLINPEGKIFAGPGDRATDEVRRGKLSSQFPKNVTIAPRAYFLLLNAPIPVKDLTPPLNGRSTLLHLSVNRPVYVASLALFARLNEDGTERAPSLEEWQKLLQDGSLAGPREAKATPPGFAGPIAYGRVAGVQRGSNWQTEITDKGGKLTLPPQGEEFAYALATVERGAFGTGQIQSAPLVVRYKDTAYEAHGNYAVDYDLALPLYNDGDEDKTVEVAFETPLKDDSNKNSLTFRRPPEPHVYFRGTVRLDYQDDEGRKESRFVHLVENQGQEGDPLCTLTVKPKQTRRIELDFIYPPDSTPPEVLTVRTLGTKK